MAFFAIFLFFTVSCEKESITEQEGSNLTIVEKSSTLLTKSQIPKATLSEQLSYKRSHLKILSYWMLKEGLPYLSSKIDNQTTTDYDTLLY
jgi:hypothetical protein